MITINPVEFWALAPEILLSAVGMMLLLVSAFRRPNGPDFTFPVTLVGLFATTGVLILQWSGSEAREVILGGLFVVDSYAFFWKILALLMTFLAVLLSRKFLAFGNYRPGEYYALMAFATTGMMLMASGYHLLSLWISLEVMALSSYILAGYFKREKRSNEAAVKYFILGTLSSAILLYGISLIYGSTGSLRLDQLSSVTDESFLFTAGWLLLGAGLFFKVSAAPFHFWTPDVYQGAPTPITAYLATASKALSFAILLRIFLEGFSLQLQDWQIAVAAVAVISMVWGNVAALVQENVKRMLAYSSIAHAGYTLLGLLAVNELGVRAVLFYLLAYGLMTLGAFGVVLFLEKQDYAGETYSDYDGLIHRAPWVAIAMLIFLLGLTGIPPTGGFVGKLYLFAAVLKAGWGWVALVGVLTSAISLYYYFRVIVSMFLKPVPEVVLPMAKSRSLTVALTICLVGTLWLGLFPQRVLEWVNQSVLIGY